MTSLRISFAQFLFLLKIRTKNKRLTFFKFPKNKQKHIEEMMSDFIKAAFNFTYNTELHIYKYTHIYYNIFISTPYLIDTIGK